MLHDWVSEHQVSECRNQMNDSWNQMSDYLPPRELDLPLLPARLFLDTALLHLKSWSNGGFRLWDQ